MVHDYRLINNILQHHFAFTRTLCNLRFMFKRKLQRNYLICPLNVESYFKKVSGHEVCVCKPSLTPPY
jgi:hypothetical protein